MYPVELHYNMEQQACLFASSTNKFEISWKEATKESKEKVEKICRKAGFLGKVNVIHQPTGSAEINSQNFRISLESGQTFLLRCCRKFSGRERYLQLNILFQLLQKTGVSCPEIACIESVVAYLEEDDVLEKTSWVFFKYIEADSYFSGRISELEDAGYQVGKMHLCLRQHYGRKSVIPQDTSEAQPDPFLTSSEWKMFFETIQRIQEKDQYDTLFLENGKIIEKMVKFVEENYKLLQDQEDVQNIHFDLNSTNFLVKGKQVFIMDFDNLSLGNVYTDIAFAFHRLITTCLQQGEKDVGKLVHAFLRSYKSGNSDLDFNIDKLIVAAYNRALWNIRTNLSLKYEKHSVEWLTSIPVNITRLKQVEYLTSAAKTLEQSSTLSTQPALKPAIPKTPLQSKVRGVSRTISPTLLTKVIIGLAFAYVIGRWTMTTVVKK